jgi:uncharacterized membrane protein YkoI
MTNKLKKTLLALAALAALALGGSALAGAAPGTGGDDADALRGGTADRAAKAALAETGGGRVAEMERDAERGASYEVEVIKADGTEVDVRLDERFETVVVETEDEDDRDDRDDDVDDRD